MLCIDHGPWAGDSGDLRFVLKELCWRYAGAPGLCIRGPFNINVQHRALTDRAYPQKYVDAELTWFHHNTPNIEGLREHYGHVPPNWERIAGIDGQVNSHYGCCIWTEPYTYAHALEALTDGADGHEGKASRRAVMVYAQENFRGHTQREGANDATCTIATQLLYGEPGRLLYVVNMRASDVIFGYTADMAWHHHLVMEHLLPDLPSEWNVCPPRIVLVANTLQIYPSWIDKVAESTGPGEMLDVRHPAECTIPGDYDNTLKTFG